MIIDCVSDLHGFFPKLEGGDLLIVAGDLTATDSFEEHIEFTKWIVSQNYKKFIVIAGNHDNFLFKAFHDTKTIGATGKYLCDSGTEFEGFKIWGSPWTKTFPDMNANCKAFTCDTEEELAEKWALIPDDTDILVTHSPPYGILDKAKRYNSKDNWNPKDDGYEHVGSKSLAYKVGNMENPPKLWVWGHTHECYGRDLPVRSKPCIMVNASHVNEDYEPVNKPIRVIL